MTATGRSTGRVEPDSGQLPAQAPDRAAQGRGLSADSRRQPATPRGGGVAGPGRVSAKQLVELQDRLSQRDRQILDSLAELRLATGRQLAGLHFTDGSPTSRDRRARAALARLTEIGLLARLARRIGGVRAGSAAHLYQLGPAGQRLLSMGSGRVGREPSAAFVNHNLAVTDLHVALAQAQQAGRIAELAARHEPACWRAFPGPGGGREILKPDLYVSFAVAAISYRWFIEVDRATEHLPTVGRKCRVYLAYWRSGLEQQRADVFPRVLWSVPDERRAAPLQRLLVGLPDPADQMFTVATHADALGQLIPQHDKPSHSKGGES